MTQWVHVSIDLPDPTASGVADAFWAQVLGWPLGEPWPRHPEFRSFEPPAGDSYVRRQRVGGPPGIHVDLEVADIAARAATLIDYGARSVRSTDDWHTLASPGGWEFCLVSQHDHQPRPAATRWPSRHRGRLVQVCIDSPARWHDQEVRFWRQALGWRWGKGSRPEFAGKLYPEPGSPVQFLLHRLGEDDDGAATRAHLDLGTDDLEADADRLVEAGATRMWDGDGWITLRDPVGMLFCTTDNSPDAP